MIELINADCRDALANVPPVDAVITDPVWPNCPPGLLPGSEDPAGLLASALEMIEAKRVVIVLRSDSDPRFLSAVPSRWPFFRLQVLPYVVPGYLGRKLGGEEIAYSFGEPLPSVPGRRVYPGYAPKAQPNRKENPHPAPRAVGHMRWLLNWWTEPGDVVLDPFMGSGTMGVACVEMGRSFIGIEIEREYYELARENIEKAPHPLFS